MSGQATGWVLRHGPHPDHVDRTGRPYGARARGLRMVLHAVADAANADGYNAHPGIEAVQRGALYGRRQTIDLLAELVAEGWLEVTEAGGGRGWATVYRLPMVPRENGAVAAETVQPAPEKGAAEAPERVQPAGETVQPTLHPNGVPTTPSNGTNQRADAAVLAAGFDRFWSAYPRATAKGDARKAWPAAVRAAGGIEVIVAGAERYRDDPNRDDRFTKHPATWLRAECWADPPLPPRAAGANPAKVRPIDTNREAAGGRLEL